MEVTTRESSVGRWRVVAALVLLCIAGYIPAFFAVAQGDWPAGDDAQQLVKPWFEYSHSVLARGNLPLWNPHILCGNSFLYAFNTQVFYPLNNLYWFLPVRVGLLFDMVAHGIILILGTYLLGRGLGMSRSAAALAASFTALSGAVAAHAFAGHSSWHLARSYLPWELWAVLRYLRTGDRRYCFAWILAAGLQMLGGYPTMVLVSFGLCAGLCLAWAIHRHRSKSNASCLLLPRGWLPTVVLAGCGFACLAAAPILTLLDKTRLTAHSAGMNYENVVLLSGTWRTMLRLLMPEFFGGNHPIQWSSLMSAHEEVGYIGLIPLLLALGAPLLARRPVRAVDGEETMALPAAVPWLWGLLPIILVLSLGDNTPLYHWLYDHLAAFRSARIPCRWLDIWFPIAALLAGFAIDGSMIRSRLEKKHLSILSVVMTVVTIAFVLLGYWLWAQGPGAPVWMYTAQWNSRLQLYGNRFDNAVLLRNAALLSTARAFCFAATGAVCLWLLARGASNKRYWVTRLFFCLLVLDVLTNFWQSHRTTPSAEIRQSYEWPADITNQKKPGERWITIVRAVDLCMPHGIDLFGGYEPLASQRYLAYVNTTIGLQAWETMIQPPHPNRMIALAGVSHFLTEKPTFEWQLGALEGDWAPWPRAYLTRDIIREAPAQQLPTLKTLSEKHWNGVGRPVVCDQGVMAEIPAGFTAAGESLRVRLVSVNENQLTVKADAPVALVYADTLEPGWKAWVNGKPTRIEHGNYLFRAIPLPAGASQVAMLFDPEIYRFALFIGFCGLVAVLGWGICILQQPKNAL